MSNLLSRFPCTCALSHYTAILKQRWRGAQGQDGEGSITQRKDGRWQASLSLPNGKRVHFLGHSWAEAHDKLLKAQQNLHNGLPPKLERQTVRQFLLHYLESTAASRKPRTDKRYRELIDLHVLPEIGAVELARLAPQQIQGLYGVLLRQGLSPSTVQQVHAILHKAFRFAVGWNLIYRNPTDHVERPRAERQETQVLSPQQVKAFLEAARGTRYEALFVLAVFTGMRQGELLGLRWRDVDLEAGILHVRYALQRIDGEFTLVEPKSAKSRRVIGLSGTVVEALRRHRTKRTEIRLRMAPPGRIVTSCSATTWASLSRCRTSPTAISDPC